MTLVQFGIYHDKDKESLQEARVLYMFQKTHQKLILVCGQYMDLLFLLEMSLLLKFFCLKLLNGKIIIILYKCRHCDLML